MNTQTLFREEVLLRSESVPVIAQFSYAGCGPCHWMENTLVEITRDSKGLFEFVSLDVTNHEALLSSYHIKSNPSVLLFTKGKEIGRLTGALPKMVVQQWIDDHLQKN